MMYNYPTALLTAAMRAFRLCTGCRPLLWSVLLMTCMAQNAAAWVCGTAVTVTVQGNPSVCPGDSVILTAPAESGMTYVWKNGTATVSGANASSLVVKTAGSYKVIITSGSCTDSSAAVTTTTRTMGTTAQHTPSGAIEFCDGTFRQLSKRILSGSYSFQWYRNDTAMQGATSASVHITIPGTYKLFLTDNNTGCSAFSATPTTATVLPRPLAVITPAGPEITLCEQDTLTLETTTAFIKSYGWEKDSMLVWDMPTFDVTAGVYRVILVDSNNCTDTSDYLSIAEISRPSAVITPGTDTAFCMGNTLTLTAVTADTGISYRWKEGSTDIPSAVADTLSVSASGAYSVVLTRNHIARCTDSTAALNVTVHPLPQPVIQWNDTILRTDQPYASYQWYRDGQPAGTNATGRSFTPETDGSYTVSVTDSNGCSNLSAAVAVNIPDDNMAVRNDPRAAQVSVYPNPVRDLLHVRIPFPGEMTITTIDGKTVLQGSCTSGVISVGHLPGGVYMIRITDRQGLTLLRQRLVKSIQ